MKCTPPMNNFLPKSFNRSINDFNLTFPENKMSMKNQIKNQSFELINNEENVKNYPNIPSGSHQILLGSLLGDMHCNKEFVNAKIEERHSIAQKEYLLWKIKHLNMFSISIKEASSTTTRFDFKVYTRKPQIRFWSKVSSILNEYYDLFYIKGKKSIRKEVLDQIDTLALAVWYCDDGSYDYQDRHIRFHTEGFSYKENLLLKNWLKNKWDLDTSFKKAPSGQVGLKLDVENTDKFLKLVKDHILEMPKSIRYKLGHLWIGNVNRLNEAKLKKELRMEEYRSKDEIKERDRIRSLEYFYKNKEKMLNYSREYCKSDKYKSYLKNYRNRPEVKERIKKYQKEYRKQPKYKNWHLEYQREYRKRPKVKEKIREYNKKAREKKKGGDN